MIAPGARLRARLPRDLPPDVFAMAGVAFCVALGFGVVAPAIPLFAEQFGVGATAAGAVVSAFALMRLVSGLGAGWLVDRVGSRTCLIVGVGVVAVSSLVAGLSQSYEQLLVLRGVGGVGSAVFGVAAISVVLQVSIRENRARGMGVYRSGFLVGGIVGPAAGGAVLGISLRAPFFLYAGTLGLAAAVAMVFLARPGKRPPPPAPPDDAAGTCEAPAQAVAPQPAAGPTFRAVLATPEYQAALSTNLAVGLTVFGLRSAIVPLLFVDQIGADRTWVAWAFLASALVQTGLMFPAARWADTAGRRPALVLGCLVCAAGLALLGVAAGLTVAMGAMVVFGAGSAFLGSVPGALVGDVTGGSRTGRTVAVFNMSSDLGAVVGPVAAGWLVERGSYGLAFGLGAAVVALAGVLAVRIPR